jgi:hypothetical protein
MAILDAIKAVQDLVGVVAGINSAPDYPQYGIMPICITHLGNGEIVPGNPTGARMELNQIVVELHVNDSGSLAGAFETLETLHPLIVAALVADTTLTGTVQTYSNLSFSTVRSTLDGVNTLSRIYVLNNCKIIA